MVTLKTSWNNVRTKTKVMGRWRDNRHTLITDLAESGAGDETIRRGDFKDFLLLREWSFASIVFLGVSIRQLIRVKVNIQRTP